MENFPGMNIQESLEQSNQPEAVPESESISRRGFLQKGLKGLAYLAVASALGSRALGQGVEKDAKTEAIKSSELSEEEREQIINSVLGGKLAGEYRKAGFEILVPLKAGVSNKYLIHVGQIHTSPGGATQEGSSADDASKFQKNLIPLLEDTARIGGGVVFSEGIGRDEEEDKKIVLTLKQSLLDLSTQEISFDKLDVFGKVITLYSNCKDNPLVRNYIDVDLAKKVIEKFDAFLDAYKPKNNDEKSLIDALIGERQASPGLINYPGFDSAAAKLYMEGKVRLAPAESEEDNNKAIRMIDLREKILNAADHVKNGIIEHEISKFLDEKNNLMDKRASGTISEEEIKRLDDFTKHSSNIINQRVNEKFQKTPEFKKAEEMKGDFEVAAHEQREKTAIRLLKKYEDENGPLANYILVFGARHDFLDQLKKYNETIGAVDNGLGLISIKKTK